MVCLPTPPQTGAAGSGSILVRAVGDRDPGTGDPIPLAGAPLTAYADAALTSVVGACATDATGTCSIEGLADATYWMAPSGDPAGGTLESTPRSTSISPSGGPP